jgi:hypothetical protein
MIPGDFSLGTTLMPTLLVSSPVIALLVRLLLLLATFSLGAACAIALAFISAHILR